MFDTHSNFGYAAVENSPGTAGTAVVIGTATYAEFPDPGTSSAYNAVVWGAGTIPLASNAEIVRVVGKATAGTLYVTRNQESSTNRDIVATDQFALSITKKTLTDVESPLSFGWTAINQTLTYASGTTVTMVGDYTSYFRKGMKMRLVQGGTTEYFSTIGAAEASGTTTLTLAGDVGTPVANAAISSADYSRDATPQGFPPLFNWTPTFGGFSSSPTGIHRYSVRDQAVQILVDQSADGTSNAGTFTMTLPVPMDSAYTEQRGVITTLRDNSALQTATGMWLIAGTAPSVLYLTRDNAQTAWTSSGGKRVRIGVAFYSY